MKLQFLFDQMRSLPGILALACILLSIFSACNTSGCLENRNSVPLAGFYSSDDKSISLDSVEIIGLDIADNVPLSKPGSAIKSIYLPMRSTQNSTSWIFQYKWKYLDFTQFNDTITFQYESTPFFSSLDCGVIYKYKIEKLTHTSHLINSIVLADSLITNVDIEQIKIYFRTDKQMED